MLTLTMKSHSRRIAAEHVCWRRECGQDLPLMIEETMLAVSITNLPIRADQITSWDDACFVLAMCLDKSGEQTNERDYTNRHRRAA